MNAQSELSRRRDAGFTLVETLVAFVILSLSLMALFTAVSQAARGDWRARMEAKALRIGRSRIDEAGLTLPLRAGVEEGRESGFRWRLSIAPYGEARPRAYWIRVTVRPDSADSPRVRLTTLALAERRGNAR